jgi:hypothetical protein
MNAEAPKASWPVEHVKRTKTKVRIRGQAMPGSLSSGLVLLQMGQMTGIFHRLFQRRMDERSSDPVPTGDVNV